MYMVLLPKSQITRQSVQLVFGLRVRTKTQKQTLKNSCVPGGRAGHPRRFPSVGRRLPSGSTPPPDAGFTPLANKQARFPQHAQAFLEQRIDGFCLLRLRKVCLPRPRWSQRAGQPDP